LIKKGKYIQIRGCDGKKLYKEGMMMMLLMMMMSG
jgi:hypothetical protein